jgi:hypothetical protein
MTELPTLWSIAASCLSPAGRRVFLGCSSKADLTVAVLRGADNRTESVMKCGARVAIGVAGGYFLGRTKKMKLAMMLAGMAAGRQAGGPGALLGQGKSLLNASPELSRLTDEIKGRLFEAGKGAALAVATRQVESLTDRVAGRVESSLGGLADAGRGKVSSRADDEPAEDVQADDDVEEFDDSDDETDSAADAVDNSAEDEEPPTNGARVKPGGARARRGEGAARTTAAATTGSRTATRTTGRATSGARRTAEKATGRTGRARKEN